MNLFKVLTKTDEHFLDIELGYEVYFDQNTKNWS